MIQVKKKSEKMICEIYRGFYVFELSSLIILRLCSIGLS